VASRGLNHKQIICILLETETMIIVYQTGCSSCCPTNSAI